MTTWFDTLLAAEAAGALSEGTTLELIEIASSGLTVHADVAVAATLDALCVLDGLADARLTHARQTA